MGALLLDMSKAFDTVSHQQLLNDLSSIGCGSSVINWFYSYLAHRSQRVRVQDSDTPWKEVSRGVPQGSCLSPLLFNIFVRDLPNNSESSTLQFADDTSLSEADKSLDVIKEKLSNSYLSIKAYCDSRGLVLNPEKTQFIVFKSTGRRVPEDLTITLENHTLKPEKAVRLLGFNLDQHLTWGKQVDSVVSVCNGTLGILRRAAKLLPVALLRMMYIALVRSHLEYCSALYAGTAKTHLEKLDVIQRKAARIILGAPHDAHSEPLLNTLRLQSLQSRREAHIIKLVTAIVSDQCHPGLNSLFSINLEGTVSVPTSRTAMGRRRFNVIGAALYNNQDSSNSMQGSQSHREACISTSCIIRAGPSQCMCQLMSAAPHSAGKETVCIKKDCPSRQCRPAIIVSK